MRETTLTLLLTGEFICDVRYPDAWRYLEQTSAREEVEHLLGCLGRRLTQTPQGGTWFAAYARIDKEERAAIREELVDIKHNLRFLVEFFVQAMQALQQDQFLAPGTLIETNRLLAAIDENPRLRNDILALAPPGKGPVGEGSARAALERLLKRLRDAGYLTLKNAERDIYAVTGKIEYLQSVVQFLMNHHGIPEELSEEDALMDNPPGHQETLTLELA